MMKVFVGAVASVVLASVAVANDVVSREDAFSVGRVIIPGDGAVEVALDRADATYACGQEAVFTVTVNGTNAVARTAGKVRWELDNYGAHVFASGTTDLAAANPFVVRGSLPSPGFLRLTVYPEKGGKPLRRYSAAFEPEKLRTAVPKPDDFDAFWDGAVAKLEREVPLDLQLEDLPEFVSKKGERMRRISCATVGGKRVYGVLLTPAGADKGRKFPVCVQCPGAGPGYNLAFCWGRRRPDRVILFMSLHGFPLPADEAATKGPYEEQEAAWRKIHGRNSARAYPVGGLTVSREAGHYYDKILGINRVVSWLAAQPFVDPTRFFYSGASQGGAMGLILGGLNPNFTRIYAGVPALTDVLGCKADGRQSGWPRITEYETQKDPARLARIQSNARYFDAAYFAERITAPIRLSVGYIDESCAPHAVCAAYNGIPSRDKRLYHGIGGHHGARNAPMDEVEAWLMAGREADTMVTSVPLRVLSPVPGETVSLTTPGRREFLGWSAEERRKKFLDKDWRRTAARTVKSEPASVTLRWYGDMPEEGFRVIVRRAGVEKPVIDQTVRENRLELWNLEVARTYTWTVRAGKNCVTASFDTQDLAPRDMKVKGVPNFRDLGGWKTADGRRVKQGLVYRSQGLNDNANYYLNSKETMALYKAGRLEELYGKLGKEIKDRIDAEGGKDDFDYGNAPWMRKSLPRKDPKPPRARLDEPTKAYLLDTLGIRSDIDLRGPNEVWGMTESPLGPRVKWFWIQNFAYGGMGQEVGKEGFKKVFKVFLEEKNYPIVFHCIGGADRTGCDAWILNGLLGVAEDDLMKDWELTCFTYEHHSFGHAVRIDHFLKVMDKVPGGTMKEKCENYVKALGFTDDDIAKFRAIMLEDVGSCAGNPTHPRGGK